MYDASQVVTVWQAHIIPLAGLKPNLQYKEINTARSVHSEVYSKKYLTESGYLEGTTGSLSIRYNICNLLEFQGIFPVTSKLYSSTWVATYTNHSLVFRPPNIIFPVSSVNMNTFDESKVSF